MPLPLLLLLQPSLQAQARVRAVGPALVPIMRLRTTVLFLWVEWVFLPCCFAPLLWVFLLKDPWVPGALNMIDGMRMGIDF
jgi:hypothetical protein